MDPQVRTAIQFLDLAPVKFPVKSFFNGSMLRCSGWLCGSRVVGACVLSGVKVHAVALRDAHYGACLQRAVGQQPHQAARDKRHWQRAALLAHSRWIHTLEQRRIRVGRA